jgi:hypothetical protein
LKEGKGFAMAFYLGHADIDLYMDRWCVYAKENGRVVEYSAQTNPPTQMQMLSAIDESGRLLVTDDVIGNYEQPVWSYNGIEFSEIRENTYANPRELGLVRSSSLSASEAVTKAREFIIGENEQENDMVVDKVTPINFRNGPNAEAEIGAWNVRFSKQMADGLIARGNGPSFHITVMLTGNGEIVAFRKLWATTSTINYSFFAEVLPVVEALKIATPAIINSIHDDGKIEIVGWEEVYGFDSSNLENARLVPAYGFLEINGAFIIVDATNGQML